jgi:glutamate-1-semialdehyde 2,1-aminomutase
MRKMTPEVFARLDEMGRHLRGRLEQMLHDLRRPGQVLGRGSLFAVHLTGRELIDYRSLVETSPGRTFFKDICHEMLGRGIVIPRDRLFGCLSTPMTETELDMFVQAFDESLAEMQQTTA